MLALFVDPRFDDLWVVLWGQCREEICVEETNLTNVTSATEVRGDKSLRLRTTPYIVGRTFTDNSSSIVLLI